MRLASNFLFALQASFFLCACTNDALPLTRANQKPYFPQRKSPPLGQTWAYPAGAITGVLAVTEKCIRLNTDSEESFLVIWHPDARLVGQENVIHIQYGDTTYKLGDKVKLGGGEYAKDNTDFVSSLTSEPLPRDCPGPYWLASGIELVR